MIHLFLKLVDRELVFLEVLINLPLQLLLLLKDGVSVVEHSSELQESRLVLVLDKLLEIVHCESQLLLVLRGGANRLLLIHLLRS